MNTDINLYLNDRQKFYDELKEANLLSEEDKVKQIKDIISKYKDKLRKYLPTCLNIVNSNYGCQFSLYKIGKDFDSSFKVIETNVKKTRQEVEYELANYRNMIDFNALSEATKNDLNLATEILAIYVDDLGNTNSEKMEYLANKPVKASSIITNVPKMSQASIEQNNDNMNTQYNPYANTPIKLNEDFNASNTNQIVNDNLVSESNIGVKTENNEGEASDNTNFSMDIFYNGRQ